MGSRIMHLVVGNEVAKKLDISDRALFLLGSIAADATTNKLQTHFFEGDLTQFTRHIHYEKFIQKYKDSKDDSFILGYYTHLITDDLWISGFFVPWLRNRIENNPSIQTLYHNDFKILNAILIDYYNIENELALLLNLPQHLKYIEEVKNDDLILFIEELRGDFQYTDEDLAKPLNFFTFDQIIGYIETSIEKSIYEIKQL